MPIIREQDRVLLHMVFCTVTPTPHTSHQAGRIHQIRQTYELDTNQTPRNAHTHTKAQPCLLLITPHKDSTAHILRFSPSCYSAEHHIH